MSVPDEAFTRAAEVAEAVPGCCLVSLGGSHAYGMERPESDIDVIGVYAVGLRRALSPRPLAKSRTIPGGDATVYELAHFAKLAAGCNPTVLEALWAPHLHVTAGGVLLRNERKAFLSRRAHHTYGGYAVGQLRKAEAGSGGSRGHGTFKREKFLAHCLRLATTGLALIETGDLQVRVPDPEAIRAKAGEGLSVVRAEVEGLLSAMDAALPSSPLPPEPDWDVIDGLVYDVRELSAISGGESDAR